MSYRGQVQGVGFRATCQSIARRLSVTGWVRNEPDGSVTLESQGVGAELDRFEGAIQDRLAPSISNQEQHALPIIESDSGFEIRWDGGQR